MPCQLHKPRARLQDKSVLHSQYPWHSSVFFILPLDRQGWRQCIQVMAAEVPLVFVEQVFDERATQALGWAESRLWQKKTMMRGSTINDDWQISATQRVVGPKAYAPKALSEAFGKHSCSLTESLADYPGMSTLYV